MKPTHGTLIKRPFRRGRMGALVLVLAVVGTRAAESQPSGPAPPCIQNGKALEARVNATLAAFRDALGAVGAELNSGDGRLATGVRAAGGATIAIAQVSACYVGAFVMFGDMINTTLHCDGWNGVGTPHSAGGPAAEAACQEAYQRLNKTIADSLIMGDNSRRTRGTAADDLKIFLDRNPPEPLQSRARDLRDSLGAYGTALDACLKEAKTWRPPQIGLSPPPKFVLPALPTPPVLTSFDGYLGGNFGIHLDNGRATVGSAEATLDGGVTISPKNDPSVKLTLNGHVVLKAHAVSSSGPGGSFAAQTSIVTAIAGGTGQQGGTWASLEGQGSARISGLGPFVVTIPNVALKSQSSNVMFTGGEASFRGCTHTLAAGSGFNSSQVLLEGSLRCGPWSLTSSSMGIDKTGVSGGGTLSAWSKSFAMSYSASGDVLTARGSLSGPDTPWIRLPGFEAEYRIEGPKLDLKLDLKLDGPSLSPTFGAGKVSVRTTAKKPDGNPWSSASLTPATVMVPAPPTDGIPVPFPVLPTPSDLEKDARDTCERVARATLGGQALQTALDVCRSGHPSPPALPALPRTPSLKVGDIFR